MANSEVHHLFELQRAEHWKVARGAADQRIAKLTRLKETILSHRHALHEGFWVDFHKHPDEVDLTEIYPTLVELEQVRSHLPDWMSPVHVKTPPLLAGAHSELRYEPRGVVLILAPWNYPFQLLFVPLIAAVAAGNCAIVRPSHKVPAISAVIARIISETFPKTEVACITETGTKLAEELVNAPFDHIFFTGSRAVGKMVMTAAAANLASVTLELGGKSPLIIDGTADVEQAAERAIWGKMINAGQTCIAPDFALVHEKTVSAFVDAAKRKIAELYGETEEARQASRDLARIIDDAAFRRLCVLIESSVAAGARIEIGGRTDPSERYIAPTILTNISWDMAIMQEEIFGPILPVLSFKALQDVPAQINALGQSLALYIFSRSQENVDLVLGQTSSGAVGINEVVLHNANPYLPFGGVGQSGQGNYHGWYGFRTFSYERSIMRQARLDLLHIMYPPYGKKTERILELMDKFAV
jgi:aldehyde dehydrogenase (NAD+)